MAGPFVELSERETSKPMWFNAAAISCLAPHGRAGSYVYLIPGGERMEVEETPGEVAARLQSAGVTCWQKDEGR